MNTVIRLLASRVRAEYRMGLRNDEFAFPASTSEASHDAPEDRSSVNFAKLTRNEYVERTVLEPSMHSLYLSGEKV